MGWYEAIKDGINVAQKADNIPLVSELIEAQKQILDLVHENERLKIENQKLIRKQDLLKEIERHNDAYITLKNDELKLIYCSNCWDSNQKLVQAQTDENGHYECPACKTYGYYDKAKYDKQREEENIIFGF